MKVEQAHNNVQWKKVKLGEVCVPSSEKYNPLTENLFQYCIEMENINQESGTLNGKSDIAKLLSLKTKFHKGEVLYGKLRPYLRKYWLADFDGACSTEIWVLKNAENIDNRFLFYLFQSESINKIANLSSGTKMPRADWRFMEKQTVSIPFKNNKPDLSAQRRIAAILASADKVIAATQKTIAKYKQMKQGMMEDLLKPREGWKMVRLGECCEINPKTDTTKVQDYDVVAFIRMEDVSNDGFITSFSERAYKSLQKKGFTVFQNDDVIFAKITPCMENGKGGLVRNMKSKICMGSTEFHVLRACANVSIDFIYQLTISKRFRQKAEMQMTGSAGQQRVPATFLEDYFISIPFKNGVPDLAEQRRIAAILSGIDAKIAAEEKVLEKYEKVKKGMMERMLEESGEK